MGATIAKNKIEYQSITDQHMNRRRGHDKIAGLKMKVKNSTLADQNMQRIQLLDKHLIDCRKEIT